MTEDPKELVARLREDADGFDKGATWDTFSMHARFHVERKHGSMPHDWLSSLFEDGLVAQRMREAADLIDRLTADRERSVGEDAVERVARAIDNVQLWERFNDWTRDCVPGLPVEICRYGHEGEDEIVVVERHPVHERNRSAFLKALRRARARAAIAATPPRWMLTRDQAVKMWQAAWGAYFYQTDHDDDATVDVMVAAAAEHPATPPQVPEGFVLVPKMPTAAMQHAGQVVQASAGLGTPAQVWSAMIAAAVPEVQS